MTIKVTREAFTGKQHLAGEDYSIKEYARTDDFFGGSLLVYPKGSMSGTLMFTEEIAASLKLNAFPQEVVPYIMSWLNTGDMEAQVKKEDNPSQKSSDASTKPQKKTIPWESVFFGFAFLLGAVAMLTGLI